jgi:nucleotide-binding universal stress UspA family protein
MADAAQPVILAATDFSDSAAAAVRWASFLARQHGGSLHLLHVLELPYWPPYSAPPPDLYDSLRSGARLQLEEAAAALEAGGAAVQPELREGIASATIVEVAEALGPAAVVVGTRGLSGLAHLLLGSTAERVVQRAPCPVLTVPPGAREPGPVRTILAPTDFSTDAEQALTSAFELFPDARTAATVLLLHAYALPHDYTAYGPTPAPLHYLEETARAVGEELHTRRDALRETGFTVEAVSCQGLPERVIVEEASQRGADLVAMGTHGHTGFAHLLLGSTAERVIQRVGCPVLTVHRKEEG